MKKGLLHHIELYVSNLNHSRDFWEWFLAQLGYEIFQEWENGFSMKFNETYIVFVQTEEEFLKPEYHRRRTGMNHLAFFAESKEQVDSITGELRKRSIPILYQDKHPFAGGPGHYAVYFEDPDRIKVELVADD